MSRGSILDESGQERGLWKEFAVRMPEQGECFSSMNIDRHEEHRDMGESKCPHCRTSVYLVDPMGRGALQFAF